MSYYDALLENQLSDERGSAKNNYWVFHFPDQQVRKSTYHQPSKCRRLIHVKVSEYSAKIFPFSERGLNLTFSGEEQSGVAEYT